MLASLILVTYYAALSVLVTLALYRLLLTAVYLRRGEEPASAALKEFPRVTVQLPVFNERYVVERLLRAAAALDYPRDQFDIQLLDDSTDDSVGVAASVVAELQAQGVRVSQIRRDDRRGYKAGALSHGLQQSESEFFAVFDADFVPDPAFLRRCIGYFTESRVGMVQARWEHLNRRESLLTLAQAVLLDGHFVVEQTARARSNRFLNFNGTAGVWRRETIVQAGGWSHDTLTEDLDLSYRAQLCGWEFRYLTGLAAPAEIPSDVASFKSQQHRWAKGSIECLRKLAPAVVRAERSVPIRGEGLMHLSANLGYPCLLLVSVLLPLVVWLRSSMQLPGATLVDLTLCALGCTAVWLFYWVSLARTGIPAIRRPALILWALVVDTGMAWHKALAVFEALAGYRSGFVRTPKSGSTDLQRSSMLSRAYATSKLRDGLMELGLAGWSAVGVVLAWQSGPGALPAMLFMAAFLVGYGYIGGLALRQAWQAARGRRALAAQA
jgi:cellulose synthase/poly-beta-1,6-N-acetylglucosamine synthase-like glycosyltransferase